ncbi:MAG: alpha/beta fold hydrolase [Vibrio sp.]
MPETRLFHKAFYHSNSSEWVVFIHGAGGSSSIWFKQLKAYRQHFNVLLVDLRGHGRSAQTLTSQHDQAYTFRGVSQDVLSVMDELNIVSAHIVAMSLGTIIAHTLAQYWPQRVKSMVLGGAILSLDCRTRCLIGVGTCLKNIVPYMLLYRLFAYIVMPTSRQQESRRLFIREAKKLCQSEFKRWFRLALNVNPMMARYQDNMSPIPTLYLMGDKDYLFLEPVKAWVREHRLSQLVEIRDCGHVCNIENALTFNQYSMDFIAQQSEEGGLS